MSTKASDNRPPRPLNLCRHPSESWGLYRQRSPAEGPSFRWEDEIALTDHPIRLFASNAAVRRVGTGLIDRSLPRADWTHEGHLAACIWLLTERPDIDAPRQLPNIIRSYNVSAGGVNDETQGYHETLTQLYIAAVRHWLETASTGSLVDRVNALLASPIGQRNWPLTLYSRERLFSVEARLGLVMPDIGEWPEL